jgi:hypothetical protein
MGVKMMKEYKNSKALLTMLGITVLGNGSYKTTSHNVNKAKEKLKKLEKDSNVTITDECLAETKTVINKLEKEFSEKNINESFLDIIDNKRNNYVNENTCIETLVNELHDYRNLIPEFFSKNGESKGIRAMYENVKNPEYENRTIFSPDLNMSQKIYEEYVDGMVNFIKDLDKSVTENSNVEKFEEKLNLAKKNDKIFVESLFGGEHNSDIELSLNEAVQNLEILVDFIPKLDNIYDRCETLKESVSSNNELVKESLNMLYESISNFCYNEVKNVIDTYYSINDIFTEEKVDIPMDLVFVPF